MNEKKNIIKIHGEELMGQLKKITISLLLRVVLVLILILLKKNLHLNYMVEFGNNSL